MRVKYLTTASNFSLTPAERQMGRVMRAPDHPPVDSAPAENNQSSNSGDQNQNVDSTQNNGGQSVAPDTFWDDPVAEGTENNSAGNDDSAAGDHGTQARSLGQQLQEQISSLDFGGGFTDSLVAEMGEGKFENANKMLAQMNRTAVQTAITMAAKIMGVYGQALRDDVNKIVNEQLGTRDNDQSLMAQFPQAASNPKLKPLIKTTFEQALKHTKGNRAAALDMTRSMLTEATKVLGTELDVTSPAGGSADNPPSSNQDFLQELLGR